MATTETTTGELDEELLDEEQEQEQEQEEGQGQDDGDGDGDEQDNEQEGAAADAATVAPDESAQQTFDRRRQALESEIAELAVELAKLKAAVKCTSDRHKAAVEEFGDLLATGPERLPLFDGAQHGGAQAAEGAQDSTLQPNATAAPPAVARDAWRAMPVDSLDLQPRQLRSLHEQNLLTLGGLSDWMQAHGDFWWQDIDGLGEKGGEKIADAFADFWAKNPEYCQLIDDAA